MPFARCLSQFFLADDARRYPLGLEFAKMIIKQLVPIILLLALCVTLNAKVPQAPAAPGKLSGMVLDPRKVYVSGAAITVIGRRVKRQLYSADDGSYSIELPPGVYVVRIAHPGFIPFRKRVEIKSRAVANLDVIFRLNPRLFGKTWIATKRTQGTYDLYFPKVSVPTDAGISLVRIVISCGHIAAVNRIPIDWYVRTLFPPHESEPEWKDFQFTSNALDFEAGHGVTRQRDLKSFQRAVTVAVDEARCFDIVVDIKDDITEDGWKIRLRKRQLVLRNHIPAPHRPNKLDRSGGSQKRRV